MSRQIVFLILITGSGICRAQSDSVITTSDNHWGINLSCIGALIYPGISTGVEHIIKVKEVYNLKKLAGVNPKIINQLLTLNLNWYHHIDFHDNIYLTAEWVRRKVKHTGFFTEFSTGPGFSRTFLGGTTYRVSDDGTVSVKKLAGYSYALVTIGGGTGYDFSQLRRFPLSVFTKLNLITMFPYNSTIYFRPVMELGFRYSLNHQPEIKTNNNTMTESYILSK